MRILEGVQSFFDIFIYFPLSYSQGVLMRKSEGLEGKGQEIRKKMITSFIDGPPKGQLITKANFEGLNQKLKYNIFVFLP